MIYARPLHSVVESALILHTMKSLPFAIGLTCSLPFCRRASASARTRSGGHDQTKEEAGEGRGDHGNFAKIIEEDTAGTGVRQVSPALSSAPPAPDASPGRAQLDKVLDRFIVLKKAKEDMEATVQDRRTPARS